MIAVRLTPVLIAGMGLGISGGCSPSPQGNFYQFFPLGAGQAAWAHDDRIDVGSARGGTVPTARHTVRWGNVLDHDGTRVLLDYGCGAPGTLADHSALCLLTATAPPQTIASASTATEPGYARGAVLISDDRILVSNGRKIVLMRGDRSITEEDVLVGLRAAGLLSEVFSRGDLDCPLCDTSSWHIKEPLARDSRGRMVMELQACSGAERCYYDTLLQLEVTLQPGTDQFTWIRLNPAPPADSVMQKIGELRRKALQKRELAPRPGAPATKVPAK